MYICNMQSCIFSVISFKFYQFNNFSFFMESPLILYFVLLFVVSAEEKAL